ncbi:MAG: KAP family P-loop NTPase fold protein [Candidatus Anammoxibacter sp.]
MWKDSETKIDFLDFEYLTSTVTDIINDKNLSPSSIGIYGNWGSGKSSLMQMCIEELSKEKTTLCIKFNGWLFEGYEDAKTALLGTILDEIKKEKTLTKKANEILKKLYENTDKLKLASMGLKYGIDFLTTGGIGTIADITVKSILSKIKDNASNVSKKDIDNILKKEFKSEELRKNIKTFQKDFTELLKESKIDKLVVFIDELDRCNPDTILDTLEAIRLFLFTQNTSFVIGADERHVIYSVRKKYSEIEGNQIDIGKEYLEKMIQYPIRIPQLSSREVEFYILCLLFQNELNDDGFNKFLTYIAKSKKDNFLEFELSFEDLNEKLPEIVAKSRDALSLAKQLSSVLSSGLNGNPRHCKRFLNSLSMREKMSSHRNLTLDRKVLAKLMLLEYFKTELFRKLSEIQSLEKGKPNEIKLIEEDDWDDIKELKLWKDDKWVIDWIRLEPKLTDVDLRPYFYFSRESLSSQLNLGRFRLSPIAEKILEDLLSGADSQRKTALKSLASINDLEANIILEKLSDKVLSDSKIDSKLFRSLLEWGTSKEFLYAGTISCLNQLTGSKLTIAIIPRVKEFMKSTGKTGEVLEIVNRWAKENQKLEAAIKKDFEEVM